MALKLDVVQAEDKDKGIEYTYSALYVILKCSQCGELNRGLAPTPYEEKSYIQCKRCGSIFSVIVSMYVEKE